MDLLQRQIERYTAVSLLASSVCQLFPEAQLLSGGVDEFGFHYHFIIDAPIDESFLSMIEEVMRAKIKESLPIKELEMMRENAADLFSHRKQNFKSEQILQIPYNIIKLIEFGKFIDVAPALHAKSTDEVSIFQLLDLEKISYYTEELGFLPAIRITGEVFSDKQQLKKFIKLQKNQKECGQRILTEVMELYAWNQELNPFSGFWLPKGMAMCQVLLNLWRQSLQQSGISEVSTPQFTNLKALRKTSDKPSFLEVEWEGSFYGTAQAPIANHASLFASKPRQIYDLPLRYAEVKEIYLDQTFPSLSAGLLKTSSQTINFIHSFCTIDQLYEELISSLLFIEKKVIILGLRCQWSVLSNRGKSGGSSKQWDQTVSLMCKALEACGCEYTKDSYDQASSVLQLKGIFQDQLGRRWSGPEITVDFELPAKLGLSYLDANGQNAKPVIVRQTTFGPLERLVALLIENDNGKLPLWLAPEQVRVISLGEGPQNYAHEVLRQLHEAGVRAVGDYRSHSLGCPLGLKVHECECARVPYALIIGEKEEKERRVNVRKCGEKSNSRKMSLEAFLQELLLEPTFLAPINAAALAEQKGH